MSERFRGIVLLPINCLLIGLLSFGCAGLSQLEWDRPEEMQEFNFAKGMKAVILKDRIDIYAKGLSTSVISIDTKKVFLTSREGKAEVGYRMAAFDFNDSVIRDCSHQTLDSIGVESGKLVLKGKLLGTDCSSQYTMEFTPKAERELEFNVNLSDESLNRITLYIQSEREERIFGLGEQFSHFDMKGKTPFLFTEEQGIGRGDQPITTGANLVAGAGGNEYTSYAPIPHYITTKHRSLFIDNSGYSKFDFSEDDRIGIEFWETQEDGGLTGTAWIGTNPLELIQSYTLKTGRMPELPEWAYGTILGLQGGTKKVSSVIETAKKNGNPVTALWIQDWCGRRVTNFGDQLAWRWYADESLYPDFKNFVKGMNRQNVRVLGYINPFLADTDPNKKGGDDFTNPMLEEAKKKGFLVKDSNGKDYLIQTVGFPAYLIDLTNPKAVKWTKSIIKKNMIDVGLSGWMADFGEWLPYDAVLHSGISAKVYHNQYPVDWAKLNREAIREAGKEGEIVFFTRAGYSYSNKYSTLFWLGDQMVSFQTHDGLPSAVLGMMSSGVSGISLNHSDIGGYTTISNPIKNYHRSKELILRWAEMSAFSPIFRTHEGNRPLKNWQVYEYELPGGEKSRSDGETVKMFSDMGKLHFAMKPYLKKLSKEASKTGLPMVRHPYLHYPEDPNVLALKYQYLLGQDLMVIPVISSGESSVSGYLPKGEWKHIWSGRIYSGGKNVDVEAPLGKPSAFIRVGGENQKLLESAFDLD